VRPVAGDTASTVAAQVMRRWQAIDPLLPVPGTDAPGCGAGLFVAGADGQPAAAGTCEHWAGAPESLDLSWGAARRFRLTVRVAGPDVADALDQLLSLWRDHLADAPGAGSADTAAVVAWPSRDVEGIATLLRRGLAPLAVIAARMAARPSSAAVPPGVRIRRAGPADLDAVVRLGMDVVRFDAHFGGVIERPGTEGALRHEAARSLAVPQPWTWLAEHDGTPIGLLLAEQPEAARWIAPMTRQAPVAYVLLMAVLSGERGNGIGAALAARLHREADAAGVAVTLLHYAQLNPLSAPFWSQQWYRPLWSEWEARPAIAIR
jgi:GNAT superfamily N-acetyltransferase